MSDKEPSSAEAELGFFVSEIKFVRIWVNKVKGESSKIGRGRVVICLVLNRYMSLYFLQGA